MFLSAVLDYCYFPTMSGRKNNESNRKWRNKNSHLTWEVPLRNFGNIENETQCCNEVHHQDPRNKRLKGRRNIDSTSVWTKMAHSYKTARAGRTADWPNSTEKHLKPANRLCYCSSRKTHLKWINQGGPSTAVKTAVPLMATWGLPWKSVPQTPELKCSFSNNHQSI